MDSSEIELAPGEHRTVADVVSDPGGRSDITAGYAVVRVLDGEEVVAYGSVVAVVEIMSGSGITAYASVIDNRTNDPTTIPMVR